MPQVISSKYTVLVKFVLPSLLFLGMALVPVGSRLGLLRMRFTTQTTIIYALLVAYLGSAIWFHCMRIKRVVLDDDGLFVSNYRSEVRVPFAAIASVSQDLRNQRLGGGRTVMVRLRTETSFGRGFTFLSAEGPPTAGREAEVVLELRRLAGIDSTSVVEP